MSDKDILINGIISKFNNNKLLQKPLIDMLQNFDIEYLKSLKTIFDNLQFGPLNSADNKLFEEINLVKENPEIAQLININNLENQLIRLQLNILLSLCKEVPGDNLSPLVNALNTKITVLNQIMETKIEKPVKRNIPIVKKLDLTDDKLFKEEKQEMPEDLSKITMADFSDIVIQKGISEKKVDKLLTILENTPKRNKTTTVARARGNTIKSSGDHLHLAFDNLNKYKRATNANNNIGKLAAQFAYNADMRNYKIAKAREEERKKYNQKGGDPYYYKYLKYKHKYESLCQKY